ncbi:hypothetical protein P5E51_16250, partial [Clostridium perfringens]|nr:hypothetical protein [Clostridium perfringens]
MSALKALVAFMAVATVAELAAGKSHTIKWSDEGNYGDWSSKNTVAVGDSVGELKFLFSFLLVSRLCLLANGYTHLRRRR